MKIILVYSKKFCYRIIFYLFIFYFLVSVFYQIVLFSQLLRITNKHYLEGHSFSCEDHIISYNEYLQIPGYKDEKKIDEFNETATNLIKSFKNDKNKYLEVVNAPTIYSWFIGNKIYTIRPKLYPLTKKYKEEIDLRKYPIYNFYKNANIEFYNEDGINIYEKYKNDESTLLFLDPPYLQSYNDFYEKNNKRINIYEYLYNNNINNEKANIFLMLEDIWINRLLFKNNYIFEKYKKMYAPKQKITNHILITKSRF
jgi:hypothetical protein